jgi:hypothetical protein
MQKCGKRTLKDILCLSNRCFGDFTSFVKSQRLNNKIRDDLHQILPDEPKTGLTNTPEIRESGSRRANRRRIARLAGLTRAQTRAVKSSPKPKKVSPVMIIITPIEDSQLNRESPVSPAKPGYSDTDIRCGLCDHRGLSECPFHRHFLSECLYDITAGMPGAFPGEEPPSLKLGVSLVDRNPIEKDTLLQSSIEDSPPKPADADSVVESETRRGKRPALDRNTTVPIHHPIGFKDLPEEVFDQIVEDITYDGRNVSTTGVDISHLVKLPSSDREHRASSADKEWKKPLCNPVKDYCTWIKYGGKGNCPFHDLTEGVSMKVPQCRCCKVCLDSLICGCCTCVLSRTRNQKPVASNIGRLFQF